MLAFTRREMLKLTATAVAAKPLVGQEHLAVSQEGFPASLASKQPFFLYVATHGNDAWTGKLPVPNAPRSDGPLATLGRAQQLVRELKVQQPGQAITVQVRGGKYFLEDTLVLGPDDSGSQEAVITYAAYPGEKPILSGGRRVTGWKPYKAKILKAELPGAKGGKWKFRQLFLNGERQIRARWPKFDPQNPLYGGWAYMEGPADGKSADAFIYKSGTFPHHWAKPTQGEVNLLPGVGSGWYNDIIPIKVVDEKRRLIELTHEFRQLNIAPWYLWESFRPDNRFVVENLLEDLTKPGEWCLDSEEGTVYFWPPEGSLGESEMVAPYLDCLIRLKGASFITITGFTFTETMGGDATHRGGLEGYGAMFPPQGWKYCGEAVHLEDTERCRVEGNHFRAVGGNGVYLSSANLHDVIRGNEFSKVGANGICLLGTRERNPKSTKVEDNHIHHCGVINQYVAGVFLGLSEMNVVGHNSIHHMPHHAINLGNRGYGRNIVEYNEIRYVCLQLFDTGAINSWMEDPGLDMEKRAERCGHIIRHNLIADTGPNYEEFVKNPKSAPDRRTGIRGIYMDTNTSNDVIYSNVIIRSGGWGFHLQNGKNNVIENNIIIDSDNAIIFADWVSWFAPQMAGNMTGNRFCRNILYRAMPPEKYPLRGGPNPGQSVIQLYRITNKTVEECDYNIFYHAPGSAGNYDIAVFPSNLDSKYVVSLSKDTKTGLKTFPFEMWQQMGYDEHSLRTDPLFIDPAHDDYRLKPESPALNLGFEPIDIRRVGIRRDWEIA